MSFEEGNNLDDWPGCILFLSVTISEVLIHCSANSCPLPFVFAGKQRLGMRIGDGTSYTVFVCCHVEALEGCQNDKQEVVR